MPRTVLIVDDEPTIGDSLAPLLEAQGLRVALAATLEDAHALIGARAFDLVIADLSLTGQHGREGLEVIAHARQSHPAGAVVLFTAHGTQAIVAEALRRGANETWSKSQPIRQLLQRAKHWTEHESSRTPQP